MRAQEAIVLLALASAGRAMTMGSPDIARVTPAPVVSLGTTNGTNLILQKRLNTELSTCGYFIGNPSKPRTADSGFNCRVDTQNALWGFCPTTVIAASDCGLAGGCVDSHACSNGCGMPPNTEITTFTCAQTQFCSTALLTFGVDQTYSYIACGAIAVTDHLQISPTAASTTPSATTPSLTTPSPSTRATTSPASSTSPPPQTDRVPIDASGVFSAGPTASGSGGGGSNNTGAIIGGVIGGLALLSLFGLGAIYLLRRDRRRNPRSPGAGGPSSAAKSRWTWSAEKHRNDGWGPRELPATEPVVPVVPREPVELYAGTPR